MFVVSILGEHKAYEFADKIPLDKCIADILEDEVDEKYYINKPFKIAPISTIMREGVREPKKLDFLDFVGGIGDKDWVGDNKKLSRNYPQGNRVYNSKGIACTQTSNGGGLGGATGLYLIDLPCIAASRGRYLDNSSSGGVEKSTEQRLEFNTRGISNTITTVQKDNYLVEQTYRIRKLTPRECFRLMGMRDDDIDKIQQAGISNTQQYKMAGNSICIPVLEYIFKQLFKEDDKFE